MKNWVCEGRGGGSSLRNLRVLCDSAVDFAGKHLTAEDAEHAELTQRVGTRHLGD